MSTNEEIMREVAAAAKKAVEKVSKSSNMKKYGKMTSDQIRKRTRTGKGTYGDDNPLQKMPPLSDKYKKQRKKDKNLSSKTTPAKSNLTRTGEMLDALAGRGLKGKIIVIIERVRNKNLVGWLENMGRSFFYLSRPERNKLEAQLRIEVEAEIDKNLK